MTRGRRAVRGFGPAAVAAGHPAGPLPLVPRGICGRYHWLL